jgi:hypothetical protein
MYSSKAAFNLSARTVEGVPSFPTKAPKTIQVYFDGSVSLEWLMKSLEDLWTAELIKIKEDIPSINKMKKIIMSFFNI